jgi:hypothetical protein
MPIAGSELFVALVGAVGTDFQLVVRNLELALRPFGYSAKQIHLAELLHQIERWSDLPATPQFDRYSKHMDAGNAFRAQIAQGDALALLAVASILSYRVGGTRITE